MRSKKATLAFLMLLSVTSCGTSDGCSWAKKITVNDADVLTRVTMLQLVNHNDKVAEFCR